jgi:hypothetical protein
MTVQTSAAPSRYNPVSPSNRSLEVVSEPLSECSQGHTGAFVILSQLPVPAWWNALLATCPARAESVCTASGRWPSRSSAGGLCRRADDRQNSSVTDTTDDAKRTQNEEFARIDAERALHEEAARIEERARNEERARIENAAPAENVLTDKEWTKVEERAVAAARVLMSFVAQYRRDVGGRTEEELIAEAPRNPQIRQPLELTRRLIDSNRNLQAELAKSRESSERLAGALSTQMTQLTHELKTFRASSDTLAGRVVWWSRALAGLTAVLLLGTIILIVLTVVLVQRTGTSP